MNDNDYFNEILQWQCSVEEQIIFTTLSNADRCKNLAGIHSFKRTYVALIVYVECFVSVHKTALEINLSLQMHSRH